MKIPKITIITASYNSEKTIKETIESVLKQTYLNIEYLIIDGGSSDNTISIVKKYEKVFEGRLKFLSEKDQGIYDAWNKGLEMASGDWISFLGSDDEYLPNAILNYVNYINERKGDNLEFVSSKVELINSDKKTLRIIGQPWNWNKFKIYMNTSHVGTLHSVKLFTKYGKFNTEFKIVGDYELLLRANKNLRTGYIDNVTAKMTVGGVSNQSRIVFQETFKAKVRNGSRTIIEAKWDMYMAELKYYTRRVLGLV
ncbi:glycosyltransferase family 2 protein [Flavobacterium fluviale]|uniref:Glycosyltransferase n=1 Tax=Flavobacterium fluviale TaxID=2249356 RepID=A0A344LN85_9FLAO|nr:glycosyltransferase family 2 protein [Flavobacterium fluviale]AXB55377.1 glycosyltransferase [Flavobacterium fluviale]